MKLNLGCFFGFHDWEEEDRRQYNSRGGGERGSLMAWNSRDAKKSRTDVFRDDRQRTRVGQVFCSSLS